MLMVKASISRNLVPGVHILPLQCIFHYIIEYNQYSLGIQENLPTCSPGSNTTNNAHFI